MALLLEEMGRDSGVHTARQAHHDAVFSHGSDYPSALQRLRATGFAALRQQE
jgi:hypothetical protein